MVNEKGVRIQYLESAFLNLLASIDGYQFTDKSDKPANCQCRGVITCELPSGYDSQFAMENHHATKFGKPSISIRAMAYPWLC